MTTLTFILVFGVVWYFVTLFLHSFFNHRYATHEQFTMSIFWERFFWLLTYLIMGSSYMPPKNYAKMHLKHHKDSDKEGDPHSPLNYSRDFFTGIGPMMLKTLEIMSDLEKGKGEIARMWKDKKFPSWPDFERFANSSVSMYMFIIIYIIIYILFAPTIWVWPLILVNIFSGAIHAVIVNWFGHMVGYRNYNTDDNSRNTLRVDFLALGELFQNNHHAEPNNPNFARKWFEFDFTYQIMKIMNWLHIIRFTYQ